MIYALKDKISFSSNNAYSGDAGSSPLLVVKTERILHVSSISQTPLYHTSAS